VSSTDEWHDALRVEWWNNHGCPLRARYGDDGELQCGACGIDFRRMGLKILQQRVMDMRLAALKQAAEPASPAQLLSQEVA
jgi:hypothetical protein